MFRLNFVANDFLTLDPGLILALPKLLIIGFVGNLTLKIELILFFFVVINIAEIQVTEMIKAKTLLNKLNYPVPIFTLCMVKESKRDFKPVKVATPRDALQLLRPLSIAAEEYFIALHLNVKHEVIGIHEVAHGTLTESLVHPREVFKAALLSNSFAVIVCHNHPSGSPVAPSSEDYTTTKQLIKAGKLLGVALIDHLILGCDLSVNAIYSFRERHPDLWLTKSSSEQD